MHESPIEPDDKAPKHKKIQAEKEFDAAVYVGLGGAANTLIAMFSADWVNYGAGKEKCAQAAERMGEAFGRMTGGARSRCVAVAHSWLVTTGLMMGGIAMLIPMKKAEDNKPQLVRWLHDRRAARRAAQGNPLSMEEQAGAEQALSALERAPKQTWGSILSGRVVGTLGVYGVMSAFGKPLKRFAAGTGNTVAHAFAHPASRGHDVIRRSADSGILDAICVTICTGTLYLWTHLIRPPKHKTPGEAPAIPEPEAPLPTASGDGGKRAAGFEPAATYREQVHQDVSVLRGL